jgi:hypothetical protein
VDFAERIEETRRPQPVQRSGDRTSDGGSPAGVLRLQRLAGNAAVTQAIQSGFAPVQRQDDELEEEELMAEEDMTSAEEALAGLEEEQTEEEEEELV